MMGGRGDTVATQASSAQTALAHIPAPLLAHCDLGQVPYGLKKMVMIVFTSWGYVGSERINLCREFSRVPSP